MTKAKKTTIRKRAPAPSKDVKDRFGNLLPSTGPELEIAGLAGVPLYAIAHGKKLGIALQRYPVACQYNRGNWNLYYKAKAKPKQNKV